MPSRVIDISLPLPVTPPVPGDPPFDRRVFLDHAVHGCEAAAWSMSAHGAAHIDFPAHFLPGGKRVGDYSAEAFFLPAVVVDCGQALRLGPELLAGADPQPGEAVL